MDARAKRRHNDWKKALRKQRIDKADNPWRFNEFGGWYDNLHQYSKNKIHCSCPMCSCKTRPKHQLGAAENWPLRDVRQFEDMNQQMNELKGDAYESFESLS